MYRKISACVDGGRAEGLAWADPGARTPIGASGNFHQVLKFLVVLGGATHDSIVDVPVALAGDLALPDNVTM